MSRDTCCKNTGARAPGPHPTEGHDGSKGLRAIKRAPPSGKTVFLILSDILTFLQSNNQRVIQVFYGHISPYFGALKVVYTLL